MQRALEEYIVEPVKTTISFHKKILDNPLFLKGRFTSNFIDDLLAEKE
jgi:acetyl-CoA carboxylase biotin carboxylase subunit